MLTLNFGIAGGVRSLRDPTRNRSPGLVCAVFALLTRSDNAGLAHARFGPGLEDYPNPPVLQAFQPADGQRRPKHVPAQPLKAVPVIGRKRHVGVHVVASVRRTPWRQREFPTAQALHAEPKRWITLTEPDFPRLRPVAPRHQRATHRNAARNTPSAKSGRRASR